MPLADEEIEKLKTMYPHLDGKTIKVWNETFRMFDTKNNGHITPRELKKMFLKMGQKPTNVELRDIINDLDTNQDGIIQFQEFLEYFDGKLGKSTENEEDFANLKAAFKMFDSDDSGEIDIGEMRTLLKNIGEKISETELRDLMVGADSDGNGLIDFNEFMRFMSN